MSTPTPMTSSTVAAATAFPAATEAALEILRDGGNAIDAAVAAGWALSVCEPSGSGLGGQSILLIRLADGRTTIIDGHSHAPLSASLESISPTQQRTGHRAATIPSTPATLAYAQKKYGALSAARALAPAIRLAEDGFSITPLQSRQAKWNLEKLRAFPSTALLFLRDNLPPPVGYVLRQPELASTLRRLASAGWQDFYRGEIARRIAQDMREHDGLITQADLAELNVPEEREPLSIEYRGCQVLSAPAPAGGAQVLLGLKALEQFSRDEFNDSDRWYELVARVVYAVFRERERAALQPADLTRDANHKLTVGGYIQHVAEWAASAEPAPVCAGVEEPGETTHLCVADAEGNVVSLTQSIQSLFGAKVVNAKLGFLYNNYLCTCPRTPHPCQLGSRVMPRSNAAPTLVLKQGRPVLTLGAAGSRRITSSILQTLSGVIDRGLPLAEAVGAPRVHALLNGKVWLEEPAVTEPLRAALAAEFKGEVRIRKPHHFWMGSVQGIEFLENGRPRAAADPRRDGYAAEVELPASPERGRIN